MNWVSAVIGAFGMFILRSVKLKFVRSIVKPPSVTVLPSAMTTGELPKATLFARNAALELITLGLFGNVYPHHRPDDVEHLSLSDWFEVESGGQLRAGCEIWQGQRPVVRLPRQRLSA